MKKLNLLVVLILFASPIFAQDELSLSLGASIPIGSFAKDSEGAAKTGFMADLLYQHQTKEGSKLWLAGAFKYQSNGADVSSIQQSLPGYTATATNWSAFSILAGPVIKVELSEKASFEPRIMIGYMSAKTPSLTIASSSSSATIPSASAGAFATLLGANFKFKTSEKMSVVLGIDYLSANPKFTTTFNGQSLESNQEVSVFNAMFGLAFKL